jgi:hypothetical protein
VQTRFVVVQNVELGSVQSRTAGQDVTRAVQYGFDRGLLGQGGGRIQQTALSIFGGSHVPRALLPQLGYVVRTIDSDIADAVAAFFEHLTKAIAFLCRVSFLQKRIAEQRSRVAIGCADRLVASEIRNKIVVACFAQIHQMRIRMVTDQMAGIVPCA